MSKTIVFRIISVSLIAFLVSLPVYHPASYVAASPAIGSMTTTIYSLADTYVNSSDPDVNYAYSNSLNVKTNSEQDFAYVMFDLSSIPSDANIISAKLKLYLMDIGGYVGNINTYYCSNSSWIEAEITWNNKPDFASEPTDERYFGMLVWVNQYYSWDVTADVRVTLDQGKMTEVVVRKSSGYATFHSREDANKPKLEVEYATKPVFIVHLESVQDTGATANLGLITFADYTFSLPTDVDVVNGSYAVTYSGGYTFVRWETTGGVSVTDVNAASTTVNVSGNGTLKAIGNAEKLEYTYDYENPQRHSESEGKMAAVRFTPLFSGQLLTARYYIYDVSSYQSNTFKVHVLDQSRNDVIASFNVTPNSEGWFDVDLSPYGLDVSEGADFYLGMEWIVGYNPDLGKDSTSPSGRSWRWNGTAWAQETYTDFMIRAVVGAAAPEVDVGVKAGDRAGYGDILFEYASNMPGYEEPPVEMNVSWTYIEILGVENSNVTARYTVIWKNGTEQTEVVWGDIATGEGNLSVGIVPPSLGAGDEISANLTSYGIEEQLRLTINGTVTRRYAGANREVNYVNITYPIVHGNVTYGAWNMSFYWDKKTGVMCEEVISFRMSYMDNETYYYMNMSMLWRMTATNMWPAVFTAHDGYAFNVSMTSNSTISNFDFNDVQMQISFNVTGPSGKTGYCNVTIPTGLLTGNPWEVKLNGTDWTALCNITGNLTHTFIYIPYTCSTNMLQIKGTWAVPEFASPSILLLFIVLTLLAVAFAKRKNPK
ncbi:MAG: DNRLRE domain-containing protein [Candidatus Bathyarchaeia archaeon]